MLTSALLRSTPLSADKTYYYFVQEYVRARLIQFAGAFARRINPTLNPQIVQQAAAEAIASLPAPEYGRVAVENRDLQLVFRHDCLYVLSTIAFPSVFVMVSPSGASHCTARLQQAVVKSACKSTGVTISSLPFISSGSCAHDIYFGEALLIGFDMS